MKVGIAGVGLLGSSMGYVLRKKKWAEKVVGIGRNREKLEKAVEIGAVDSYLLTIDESLRELDIIVIALPVEIIPKYIESMIPYLKTGVIITDVGSTKKSITTEIEKILPDNIYFVGGHPMAGSEKTGVDAMDPFLFENAVYVVTRSSKSNDESVDKIKEMAGVLDARVIEMESSEHDISVAAISHLPHIAAAVLVNSAAIIDKSQANVLSLAAGGFRDTTRIAAGSPEIWRDISISNSSKIVEAIEIFEEELKKFKEAIIKKDGKEIYNLFEEAKKIKDSMPKKKKGFLLPMTEIVVYVPDKPGIIGTIANIFGESGVNIKDIEVLHVRENEGGSIRIGVDAEVENEYIIKILKNNGFEFKIIE